MKLNRKQNLIYVFLLLIIGSHLFTLIETRNSIKSRLTKKNKQKYRKAGQVCYHSVPHWEEKNGNLPCQKGYICRPPSGAIEKKGKPVPFKCFKDNKKGWKGPIHFASKKQREDSDSYLFEIYTPHKISIKNSRESSEESTYAVLITREGDSCGNSGSVNRVCDEKYVCRLPQDKSGGKDSDKQCLKPLAQQNEVCYQPISNFKTKECVKPFTCRPGKSSYGVSGSGSSCLEPFKLGKKDEECANFRGSKYRDCEPGLVCKDKPASANDKIKTEGTKTCQGGLTGNFIAKAGEACYQSTPNYVPKKCPDGYQCRFEDSQGVSLSGSTAKCLKNRVDGNSELANEGDVCRYENSDFRVLQCRTGLQCMKMYSSAHNQTVSRVYRCIKFERGGGNDNDTISIVGEGQVCSKPTPGFKSKACSSGLVCRVKETDMRLSGVSSYCLPPLQQNTVVQDSNPYKIGELCSHTDNRSCPSGHICKPVPFTTGHKRYCLLPSAFDSAGYVPYVGKDNYCSHLKACEPGLTCLKVFDSSKICVSSSYDYNGRSTTTRTTRTSRTTVTVTNN